MKKVFYVLSFASMFILFSAFISTDSSTINLEKEDVSTSEVMIGSGRLAGCYIAGGPATITYRLDEQNGPGNVTGTADCIGGNVTLAMGEWDVFATSFVPAFVVITYDFCGVQQQIGKFHPGNGLEIQFNAPIFIPC